MSTFKDEPATWSRVDYAIVKLGWCQLYLSNRVLAEDVSWLANHSYEVLEFSCGGSIYKQLGEHLCFSDTYNERSIDSLVDCLRDICPHGIGLAIVLRHVDSLPAAEAHMLLSALVNAAREHFILGRRILILAKVNDSEFQATDIGAIRLGWNGREWLDSARARADESD